MYKKSEVELAANEYFKNELAASVWVSKYALKIDEDNFIELSPNDTIVRLTKEIVRIENNYRNPTNYDTVYNLLKGYNKFVLGGSCLFGIGNNLTYSTLGNCFTLPPVTDSYGGIMKADQEQVQLMKRRGGVGFDISLIRPKDSKVSNAASTSTGILPFMERFSNSTREVAQEGRRGALILTISINHPEIERFILAKDDLTKITGANISVRITDKFMKAVEEDKEFPLSFSITSTGFVHGSIRMVRAKELWNKLIHQSWKNAEPGLLFWDRIIEESPADCYPGFITAGVNPCSELPLCAYDSCRISAVNLYAYIINPFTKNARFDFESFSRDVSLAQRIMDDIVDLEHEKIHRIIDKILSDPEPKETKSIELNLWNEIHDKLMIGRRTGLGLMGLADAGAALGLRYGDDKFISFAIEVVKTQALYSYMSSIDLAEDRGAFILFDSFKEKSNPFIKRILANLSMEYLKKYDKVGRRNIANLTIAPTGTISILAGVSNGIEPVYALQYTRNRKVSADNLNKKFQDKQGDWWEEYEIYHPKYEKWVMSIEDKITGHERDVENSPYYKSTAYEVDNLAKVRMQGAVQTWIDHGISVTYNLPKTATEQDVNDLYLQAWKSGCKGITVYRDGCRQGVLTTRLSHKPGNFNQYDAVKRPKDIIHDIYNVMAKGKNWVVLVGLLDNIPYELFAFTSDNKILTEHGIVRRIHKGRYDLLTISNEVIIEDITNKMSDGEEAFTRTISWALRHGAKLEFGVDQLNKSKGDITSFSKAIARTLKRYTNYGYGNLGGDNCPNCNNILISEGGCLQCTQCGFSKCE